MRNNSLPKSTWLWLVLAIITIAVASTIIQQMHAQFVASQDQAASIQVDEINQQLKALSLEQKIASLLMLHTSGTDQHKLTQFIQSYQPGGIILMGDNIPPYINEMRQLTQAMQAVASPQPIFIAMDEEGCKVKRLPQDTFKCAAELGPLSANQTKDAFKQRSQLLNQAGINLNFGIVADITSNPDSFIYPRVFGHDPNKVSTHVAAAIKGSKNHVFSTIKHFPGHGLTNADSHTTLPQVNITKETWLKRDALPFIAGIDSQVEAVMMSHVIYPQVDSAPASLSPAWHQILSQDLHFKGIIVTDDLIMLQQSGISDFQDPIQNVVAAIKAGNNINLLVTDHNIDNQPQTNIDIQALIAGVAEQINAGHLSLANIDRLAYQNLKLRSQLSTLD